tara:strand:- start:452 stop:1135 length:684 start_codon:yes stop_codon:yes gene_type:complete
MKKFTIIISTLLLFYTYSSAHVTHYKNINYLEYELFRNDQLIGYHKYNFDRERELLTVRSKVEFKINKLGVNLYKYEANSEEVYKNDSFLKFSSKTIQNNKEKFAVINYDEKNDELLINGSSYKGVAPKDFIVGTWWNHEIINAKAQISAISGRIIKQKVTFKGKEKIKLNGITYNALHFNFSSSDKNLPEKKKLNTDIWYDEKTLMWIKASFDKTGFWEYRLKEYN